MESGSDRDMQDYSAAIKVGQRSSPNFKQAWSLYCSQQMQTYQDPARHGPQFIQTFFDQLGIGFIQMSNMKDGGNTQPIQNGQNNNGNNNMNNNNNSQSNTNLLNNSTSSIDGTGKSNYGAQNRMGQQKLGNAGNNNGPYARNQPAGPASRNVGKGGIINPSPDSPLSKIQALVKMGQRNCPEWKQMWIEWCSLHGNGIQDPARHSSLFILAFVLRFGLASVVASSWSQQYLVSLGELAKPYMTATIARGCRESDTWNELWSDFADGKGVNLRDPFKHDAGSLMEFFDMTAMVQFSGEPWMACYQCGDEEMHARGS